MLSIDGPRMPSGFGYIPCQMPSVSYAMEDDKDVIVEKTTYIRNQSGKIRRLCEVLKIVKLK